MDDNTDIGLDWGVLMFPQFESVEDGGDCIFEGGEEEFEDSWLPEKESKLYDESQFGLFARRTIRESTTRLDGGMKEIIYRRKTFIFFYEVCQPTAKSNRGRTKSEESDEDLATSKKQRLE